MPFDADIRQYKTIAAFTAYLRTVPRPSWCDSIVVHNTYKPDEFTWAGMATMRGMMNYYIGLGWSSGPHAYLVATAPNPADTGIWTLTPLSHPGTHAGQCNSHSIGLEVCGDFNARPPTADQYTLLIAVNRAIMEHWQLPPETITVHNECMPGRTCPGKYLPGVKIRTDLRATWPFDPFAAWGSIGKPDGIVRGFAVPRAWLNNKKLGRCVQPETYSASGKYSLTEFESGIIVFLKARNVALVEMFVP